MLRLAGGLVPYLGLVSVISVSFSLALFLFSLPSRVPA